eukprot:scaffold20853_cov56-Attheya_sp.AAC.2
MNMNFPVPPTRNMTENKEKGICRKRAGGWRRHECIENGIACVWRRGSTIEECIWAAPAGQRDQAKANKIMK